VSDFLERIAKLSPKRLALLALELNTKLARFEQRATEPIAVTGIGCRFPGGANDPDSFWRLLIEGRDAIREVPAGRWDINTLYDPDPDAPGKMSTRWGGFLDEIDQFNPEFFGISPREAAGMDPQQRLLLEVVWEALENAGQNPDRLAGSRSGVFVGLCNSDYFLMQFEGGRNSIDAYVATGNAHSVASGRISYILGLQGPSISVDTGCSASLVAVHLACQSLRAGECRMALAGGVNLILMPDTTIVLSKAHMMAPDGRCKPFDASANGFVRSEGCGIIVLKRLPDARADGDRILAVIGGTASNQDGRSNGLTAPNAPSQVAVIREALVNAGLQAGDIDFIEAHGTGTSLGDPIEARALADVFGQGRTSENALRVGSVKSNFGHAEAAAGIAGLIKVILAMHHERIPPSLHLEKINPHIDWDGLPISVPTVATSWNRKSGSRAAGISSFGFSGTNAHVIVSDPPGREPTLEVSDQSAPGFEARPPLQLLPLSARTEEALKALVTKYLEVFTEQPDLDLADVCHTAGMGRSHFEHRLAIVAGDLPEAKERLMAFQLGEKQTRIRAGRSKRSIVPGIVFMFTGQGSQYPAMGRFLFETQPVFRRELEKCNEILQPLLDKSLLEVLFSDGSKPNRESCSPHLLDETQYTQPALFALEYGLAAMWRSWGVEPAVVLGHSVGEYVAACVAGVFNLEDGLRLIAERGRLMATLPAGGVMAAVFADESRVAQAIAAEGSKTAIACINGPANVVVSGASTAVKAVLDRLLEEGIKSRHLVVSHAFHSPFMDPILDSFQGWAAKVKYSEPLVAIVSNVTGQMASPGLMISPEYWRRHIRNPVRFADSIRVVREAGRSVFLEIGPHPVLEGLARTTAPEAGVVWAASLKRGEGNWETLLDSASTLYTHGIELEWSGLHPASRGKRITLPTYPFQRSRFWLEGRTAVQSRVATHSGSGDRTRDLLPGQVTVDDLTSAPQAQDEGWFYEVQWRDQDPFATNEKDRESKLTADFVAPISPGTGAAISPGFWVVMGDTNGIADELAILLSAKGEGCKVISQGTKYLVTDEGKTVLDPLRAEDFNRLFSEELAGQPGPVQGIVNLWPVDEEIAAKTTPLEWEAAQARLAGGVLHATQAFLSLQAANISSEARLWFATRGAQSVLLDGKTASGPSQPAQALVWGLARVISLEHPGRFGSIIDLDLQSSPRESAAAIWHEIKHFAEEDAVAYRGRRLVPRVVRVEEPPSGPLILRGDGSYLITGGLGGLGLQIAGWLAARGAGHIVLLSRRDFPERSQWGQLPIENKHYETVQRILEAEKLGARITVAQGDVADETGMRSLFRHFGQEDPPLRGVVHAALEVTTCSICDLKLQSFQKFCRAKAVGAWVLNQLTLQMELDFFVLFSSTAAVWGVGGLGQYAAANQALDQLAHWRHERGLRALSVNWGAWQEMRLASVADREQFVKSGLHSMPNARALAALERLIATDRASSIVASIDWNALRAVYETRGARPLFAEMGSRPPNETPAFALKKVDPADCGINLQLQSASPARRRDILIAHLRSQTSSILGFDLSRQIELEQGLFDMGMDSLMAVELRGRLERSLNAPLPSTLTFNYPTIQALTNYLLSEVLQFDTAPSSEQIAPIPPAAPVKVESVLQPSEDLSEDEVSILLLQKLERMQ
jgi:acyl transferase domain-containing protein/acyl carrier protein